MGLQHVAVYRATDLIDDRQVLVWTEAANVFLREMVWPHWGRVPAVAAAVGEKPPNFSYYGRTEQIVVPPQGTDPVGILVVCGKSDVQGIGGYHLALGRIPAARSFVEGNPDPSQTFLHEAAEMACNPFLDLWWPGPRGVVYSNEVGDPVQAQNLSIRVRRPTYGIDEIVEGTNVVLPAYFGIEGGMYDLLGRVHAPFTIAPGGYQIARENDGKATFIYAGTNGRVPFGAQKFDPLARTCQILSGVSLPRPI